MKTLLIVLLTLGACGGVAPPETGESTEELCGNGVHSGCGQCMVDPSSPTGGSKTCWTCDGDSRKATCPRPTPPCGGNLQTCCANSLCNFGYFCANNNTCLANDASWCGAYGQPCCQATGSSPASGTWCAGSPTAPVCNTAGHYYCVGEISQ
jgi:hypothetical protein